MTPFFLRELNCNGRLGEDSGRAREVDGWWLGIGKVVFCSLITRNLTLQPHDPKSFNSLQQQFSQSTRKPVTGNPFSSQRHQPRQTSTLPANCKTVIKTCKTKDLKSLITYLWVENSWNCSMVDVKRNNPPCSGRATHSRTMPRQLLTISEQSALVHTLMQLNFHIQTNL